MSPIEFNFHQACAWIHMIFVKNTDLNITVHQFNIFFAGQSYGRQKRVWEDRLQKKLQELSSEYDQQNKLYLVHWRFRQSNQDDDFR